ncbi:very long chain fatty acid elongase AAEL008004 [Anabrus simplex]|uniref:very long chain fatty acid elongase AAEL008004 n=1 Tax=Anabrus simplex TaxID=316456 RepID=UPI0034DD09A1
MMRHRKPFHLKKVMMVYNTVHILSSFFIFYKILTIGFLQGRMTLGCEVTDYSDNPESIKLLTVFWYTTLQKIADLIETVFFILRKKYDQASFLHIYHHVSTLAFSWATTKYAGGGMQAFPVMLNALVHTIMYIYYFLALSGPEMQRKLAKWKRLITVIQMVQFCIMLVHGAQAMLPDCESSKVLFGLFIMNIFLVFYMFYVFYQKTYVKRRQEEDELSFNGKKGV